jgi:hypothetical protein
VPMRGQFRAWADFMTFGAAGRGGS